MSLRRTLSLVLPLAMAACHGAPQETRHQPGSGARAAPPRVAAPAAPAAGAAIMVIADARGFTPSSIVLRRGAPAILVFKRTTPATCATAVVFPQLGVEKALPVGEEVSVEIPTETPRTLAFQCGMGMYRSKVVVE